MHFVCTGFQEGGTNRLKKFPMWANQKGAFISNVDPNGPSKKAGLEAGDVILVKLIKTMAGNDEWLSGYYLIKDLRHTVHFTETGVQCYTYLRLVRDTPGDA